MYFESSQLVFSPSDLTQFMDSPFASWMEHLGITNPDLLPRPDENDELVDVLQSLGKQHELGVLTSFQETGLTVANLLKQSESFNATKAAMQIGVDVIYQAHLELPPFRGYADFLLKTQGKSIFGDYQYEVWDTKLAKSVKPYFLVQLCCYAEMLEAIQGTKSEYITVVLGNKEHKQYRTADYYYFYQNLKQQFLSTHQKFNPFSRPDSASSKNWGRWSNYAEDLLVKADHLIQVATITSGQIKKLYKAGINTMTALANADCKMIKGIKPEQFERLKAQAKIQKESIGKDIPSYQLIPNGEGKKQGLALLPPLSQQDIFF